MRLGVLFVLLAVAMGGLAVIEGGFAWIGLWPTLSFLLVGAAGRSSVVYDRPVDSSGEGLQDRPILGRVLDGRYRVDREIGKGGFGTVYAGLHLTLDVAIAIKVFRLADTTDGERRTELLADFLDEARLISRLRHDNIVRMMDQGFLPPDERGSVAPYAVMEFCPEGSLRQFLEVRNGVPLALRATLELIDGIVSGVRHAHEQGIAHRDLKPANVMLSKAADGSITPRIIDFGIAKLIEPNDGPGSGETLTRSTNFMFTPGYAAPEQAVGGRTGVWTDVHAIGLMFVELLTGQRPYGEDDVSLRIIDPVRPTPAAAGVDAGPFEAIIARCLAIRPSERYADAGELQEALRAALLALAVSPTEVQDLRRSTMPPSTSRRTLVLGAGAAGVAGVAGVMSYFAIRHGLSSSGDVSPPAKLAPVPPELPTAPSSAPSTQEPALAAPPRLAHLSAGALLKRMVDAGLPPITPPAPDAPTARLMLSFWHASSSGAVYLNQVTMPDAFFPKGAYAMHTLMNVRAWIAADRKLGFELAYGVQEDWALSMTWGPDPDSRALDFFHAVAKGLEFDVQGCSWSGYDATGDAKLTRKLWVASNLGSLTRVELLFRLEDTGAKIQVAEHEDHFVASLRLHHKTGEIALFVAGPGGAESASALLMIERLRKKKVRFSSARNGAKVLVAHGPLMDALFLDGLLFGLSVEMKTEPA